MDKLELVKRNTAEILTENDLKNLLDSKKKLTSYYGTAPTGPFHMGYLIPLGKIFDFDKAGIKNKILIADIHAALDDLKTFWEDLKKVGDYYQKCIELSFPWDKKPAFVSGTDFQLKAEYMLDVLKMSSFSTVKRATRAASEVTRMKIPKVSELIYPIMQSLDEQYLEVDIQLGGIDQRHIMAFARENLPKLGYKARVEVMTPLVASLRGVDTKMSASIPSSHIKVYDSEEQIKDKISKAYCPVGDIAGNAVVQLCQYVILPIQGKLKVERDKKFGGDIVFSNFEDLKKSFVSKKLHPADLKSGVAGSLSKIFSNARNYFEKNEDILKDLGKEFLP